MRPYWKGYLKLALVLCPIALHAACSTSERIAVRQINMATGHRLRQQLIDEETRQPVTPGRSPVFHKARSCQCARVGTTGSKASGASLSENESNTAIRGMRSRSLSQPFNPPFPDRKN